MSWDHWQAPDRDSVKTLDEVSVALGHQTALLLQMEGAKGTVDAEVEARTGVALKRARRPHKLLERMGVLYLDAEGNTRLTDLGRSLREIPETNELRRRVADASLPILAKYQLKNPVDDPHDEYPADADIHPYWAIWKAASELDWRLHWDELNREIFWVLKQQDLDDAVERIRSARKQSGYDPVKGIGLRARAYNQADAPAGKTPDGQVRDQKTTPWFRKAGFGGLILEEPGHTGEGYWLVPEDLRDLVLGVVQKAPPYYEFDDPQDWYVYFGSYDTWATAPRDVAPSDLSNAANEFFKGLTEAKLQFGAKHQSFVRSFLSSVLAKKFVILTGLSGSGKTQVAQKLGQWFGSQHYDVVPVRPDWTGPEPLVGYEDVLTFRDDAIPVWKVPRVLEFAVTCRKDPLHPYLLILDEMNLAHVEQYFADFLSGIESGEPVLPDVAWDPSTKQWLLLSRNRLPVPENLFIVGTVNVDETTYAFSPKVLDRAQTIEFRVLADDIPDDAITLSKPGLALPGDGRDLKAFLDVARDPGWHVRHADATFSVNLGRDLKRFQKVLQTVGFEFGYRLVHDAARFAVILRSLDADAEYEHIVDRVIIQKLLPRLHGSRRRLEPVLCLLAAMCFGDSDPSPDFDPLSQDHNMAGAKHPDSFEKLVRMTARIRADHFASFAE